MFSITVGCTILRGDQTFNVDHGDFFVDVENCQRCLCNNGEATSCESSVCTALQRVPPGCTYRGQSYRHGDSLQVNTCIDTSVNQRRWQFVLAFMGNDHCHRLDVISVAVAMEKYAVLDRSVRGAKLGTGVKSV